MLLENTFQTTEHQLPQENIYVAQSFPLLSHKKKPHSTYLVQIHFPRTFYPTFTSTRWKNLIPHTDMHTAFKSLWSNFTIRHRPELCSDQEENGPQIHPSAGSEKVLPLNPHAPVRRPAKVVCQ